MVPLRMSPALGRAVANSHQVPAVLQCASGWCIAQPRASSGPGNALYARRVDAGREQGWTCIGPGESKGNSAPRRVCREHCLTVSPSRAPPLACSPAHPVHPGPGETASPSRHPQCIVYRCTCVAGSNQRAGQVSPASRRRRRVVIGPHRIWSMERLTTLCRDVLVQCGPVRCTRCGMIPVDDEVMSRTGMDVVWASRCLWQCGTVILLVGLDTSPHALQ